MNLKHEGRLSCFWDTWQISAKYVEGSSPRGVLARYCFLWGWAESRSRGLLPASSTFLVHGVWQWGLLWLSFSFHNAHCILVCFPFPSQLEPSALPKLRRWIWMPRETKAAGDHRIEYQRGISCPEGELQSYAKYSPWVFNTVLIIIRELPEAQERLIQRVRENFVYSSHRAMISACSCQPNENLKIHGSLGLSTQNVLASLLQIN